MNLNSEQQTDNIILGTRSYSKVDGVIKPEDISTTSSQKQTQEAFGFKWQQEDTFSSEASCARMGAWVLEKYLSPQKWLAELNVEKPVVMDAGCGAGLSGFEYWGPVMDKIHYYGIDISSAVDVAYKRFQEKGYKEGTFLQENLADLPFDKPEFDIIFSEGVLHHSDSTEKTFSHLCRSLKSGGLFMFYVYRKKGPIREFTDDYIRDQLQTLSPEEGWDALKGLTQLGIDLGKLNIEIDIPEEIKVLDIPAGKINLQRLFYWHVFKAFYDPNLSFGEMQHINFDWYAPKNAHRHTVDEIRNWCESNGLEVLHEKEELAGITCVAKKK